MKRDTKVIIALSIVVIGLLSFISYYFVTELKNTKTTKEIPKEVAEPVSSTENSSENTVSQVKEDYTNLGKEIQINVNNGVTLPFYILAEDETTYTLLLKESLGKTVYFSADDCNSSNESGCEHQKGDSNITQLLKEKTNDWNNVGEVRIPRVDDYDKLKNLNKDISFLDQYSFWLEDDEKNTNEKTYYNKDEKSIAKDKIYNEQELRPLIRILKIFEAK